MVNSRVVAITILLLVLASIFVWFFIKRKKTTGDSDPEVYYVGGIPTPNSPSTYVFAFEDAENVANLFKAKIATPDQLIDAQAAGADWCQSGWLSDGSGGYPINTSLSSGCAGTPPAAGVPTYVQNNGAGPAGVNLYGVKPSVTDVGKTYSTYMVFNWNSSQRSRFDK